MYTSTRQIIDNSSGNSINHRQKSRVIIGITDLQIKKLQSILIKNKLHNPPNIGSGMLNAIKYYSPSLIAILYVDSKPVGSCVIDKNHGLYGDNIGVYIHHSYRNLGFGRLLLNKVLKKFPNFVVHNEHPFYKASCS